MKLTEKKLEAVLLNLTKTDRPITVKPTTCFGNPAKTAHGDLILNQCPHYERGFIDGMQKQMQFSVDKAVNRMAQPEQEPVAWWNDTGTHIDLNVSGRGTPLYTTPTQRTWVGLTNDEVNNFAAGCHLGKSVQGAIYEAEAKLKEKNT